MIGAVQSAREALFAAARGADIADVAGVKLYRSGKRLRGECPVCGASKGKRTDGAFSADPHLKVFRCFTDAHPSGDVIFLEQELRGGTAREAAERLAPGEAMRLRQAEEEAGAPTPAARPPRDPRPAAPPRAARVADDSDDRRKRAIAAALWGEASPAPGTLVETYLRARGIEGWPVEQATNRVRFHPAAFHHVSRGEAIRYPAMVGLVTAPGGATGGVHVTYLRDDGRAKARTEPAKRMWGPQTRDDAAGCVWLTSPMGDGPLLEGEGIESTLSAAVLTGRRCRMAATLSLAAMQGGWLTDRYGRRDPDLVAADPDRPGFTWPAPADRPWGEILLAVDRDMKPIRIKARKATGGTYERELGAEERARVCAALAEQSWRRAGERCVRVLAPAAGRDFNDELRAERVGVR